MKTQMTRLVVAAGLVLGAVGQAQAVGYCNLNSASIAAPLASNLGGPTGGALAVTDVTYNSANSENCYGVVSGNDTAADLNSVSIFGQNNWKFLAKSDSGGTDTSDPFEVNGTDYTFTLKANQGLGGWGSGGWTLTVAPGTGLPISMDFVAVLKGGNGYAAYLFDDVAVNANNTGTFTMSILNRGGQIAGLSHLSLYARVGEGSGSDDDTDVPEPATLALMGLALGGLGLTRRRRKAP